MAYYITLWQLSCIFMAWVLRETKDSVHLTPFSTSNVVVVDSVSPQNK